MKTKIFFTGLLVIMLSSVLGASAQDGATVLNKVETVTTAPSDMYQQLTITLIDKNGRKQIRKAELWQKGTDKRLFKFSEPASYKGIGFLSLPGNVMYLYMPAYGKERRIASNAKNQKFAGTDLTYDDMEAKKYSEKYIPKLLKTTSSSYVLQLTPKSKTSAYSKVLLTVNKTSYVTESAEYYDKGGNKIKTMTTTFVKSGKYWYAKSMTVKDLKRNHTTVMRIDKVEFDKGLAEDVFSVRNLKK